MSFKANFYEALVWIALEKYHKKEVIYEPSCSNHNCNLFCQIGDICEKIINYEKVLYTLPDFYVETKQPYYYHVCYWNSKETSHAKFWRTISELFDLKRHVINSKSICVVFETTYLNGKFYSPDWYDDHLVAFKELFDGCIFFDDEGLANELIVINKELEGKGGTKVIYDYLKKTKYSSHVLNSLIQQISEPIFPTKEMQEKKALIWESEHELCKKIDYINFDKAAISPLRNAILQIVLISMLDIQHRKIKELLESLSRARELVDLNEIEFFNILKKLPISYRNKKFNFIVETLEDNMAGDYSCKFSEDIEWFLWSFSTKSLPSDRQSIINAIEKTKARFEVSEQVQESVKCIQQFCSGDIPEINTDSREKLWQDFLAICDDNKYNIVAELLIDYCGLGTYPLVRALNQQCPALKATRNDIRALYSNRKAKKKINRQKQIFLSIANLIPENNDFDRIETAYLLRKCNRVIGPQSAINPLEILIFEKLNGYSFKSNVIFSPTQIELKTLASDLAIGNQAGVWRVAMSLKRNNELIPIFFSSMKSIADCGHKTREFSGHLCLARYRNLSKTINRSKVKLGIAVLEGAYSNEDRKQFHLSGYEVCDVSSLTETLSRLDLIKVALPAIDRKITIDKIDLPLAAELKDKIKLSKEK